MFERDGDSHSGRAGEGETGRIPDFEQDKRVAPGFHDGEQSLDGRIHSNCKP